MSLTVCTDELLMDLAPPSRIASISYLSREKAALKLWPEAARLPVNHNSAEEILTEKPDLVLTLVYASTDMRGLLEKSGIRFLEVPQAGEFRPDPRRDKDGGRCDRRTATRRAIDRPHGCHLA